MGMEELLLTLFIFIMAALYSSVGHAGAYGYLAAMVLCGLAPHTMRPAALVLNVLVALLATYRYTRAGQNDLKLLLPFVITSIPAAFIGGMMHVLGTFYKPLIGILLLVSAIQLLRTAKASKRKDRAIRRPPLVAALATGTGLGFLAGLSGTGGATFLSPLLLFMGWSTTRQASGIVASFSLANSLAGVFSNVSSIQALPSALPLWAVAALLGGLLGTHLGTRTLTIPGIRMMLAVVLVIAGGKMLFI